MEYEQYESEDTVEDRIIMQNEIIAKDAELCKLLGEIQRTKVEIDKNNVVVQNLKKKNDP